MRACKLSMSIKWDEPWKYYKLTPGVRMSQTPRGDFEDLGPRLTKLVGTFLLALARVGSDKFSLQTTPAVLEEMLLRDGTRCHTEGTGVSIDARVCV